MYTSFVSDSSLPRVRGPCSKVSYSLIFGMIMLMKKTLLDKTFIVSLVLKGIDGILEIGGGIFLLLLSPDTLHHWIQNFVTYELSRNEHEYISRYLISSAGKLDQSSTLFGALYLLTHGLVKVILVVAVLKNKLWAYPWMIGFLVVFIVYQIYLMIRHFTLGMFALTIFDIFIVFMTAVEYQRHRAASRDSPA